MSENGARRSAPNVSAGSTLASFADLIEEIIAAARATDYDRVKLVAIDVYRIHGVEGVFALVWQLAQVITEAWGNDVDLTTWQLYRTDSGTDVPVEDKDAPDSIAAMAVIIGAASEDDVDTAWRAFWDLSSGKARARLLVILAATAATVDVR